MKNQEEILLAFVKELGDLNSNVVITGGITLFLYLDSTLNEQIGVRATQDIDIILNTETRSDYYKFIFKLKEKGFKEIMQEKNIAKLQKGELIIDIIPTRKDILGFTNRWYKNGFKKAQTVFIGNYKEFSLKILRPPYFLATKLEAFFSRGIKDIFTSKDLDDIIFLINVRKNLKKEIKEEDIELQKFIKEKLRELLDNEKALEFIKGYFYSQPERSDIILKRIKELTK